MNARAFTFPADSAHKTVIGTARRLEFVCLMSPYRISAGAPRTTTTLSLALLRLSCP